MNLGDFKKHIESLTGNSKFDYSISEPFSWRGIYAEVGFAINEQPSKKAEVLEKIQMAYDNEFTGYKGGEYRYNDYTEVHFEEDISAYTSGDYCANWIATIEGDKPYESQEHRLVNLAFKP